jgi:hypothetical protein
MRQQVRENGPGIHTRVRVILASFLIVGIAVTGTLAAWSDPDFSIARFEAGDFALASRTDTGVFIAHGSQSAATLNWPLTALLPGQSKAAWVQIQSTGTVTGSVSLSGVQVAEAIPDGSPKASLRDALKVRVSATVSADAAPSPCTTGTAGTEVTGLTAIPVVSAQPLQPAGGTTVTFCVVVTLAENAPSSVQGIALTPTWIFTGSTG